MKTSRAHHLEQNQRHAHPARVRVWRAASCPPNADLQTKVTEGQHPRPAPPFRLSLVIVQNGHDLTKEKQQEDTFLGQKNMENKWLGR